MKEKNLMKIQEFIHPLLLKIFSTKTPGDLIVDGSMPTDGTYLIVANHLCIQDIPQLGQAVKEHFYLLVSDEDKKTIDGLGLTLNGVKWVHRVDKKSRQNSAKEAINTLKAGKNFAMYPEATWNLSPNLLMLPMNYGCIKIALEADVPIIPVVTLFSEGERHTKIGDSFKPSYDLENSINILRDIMATMFFEEIVEYYQRNFRKIDGACFSVDNIAKELSYYEKRDNIDCNYWKEYIDNLYNQYERAKKDKSGVREFESQFIFTPKTDDYSYFQEFNSIVRNTESGVKIKRISSEKNGYNGSGFEEYDYNEYFGLGYNEHILKKQLTKR